MKITIYTITDCQFSKQEKEYLTAHKLPFEEKNLETNHEYLTEMLNVSNNFAGTPVTKLEKDDGNIVVLKGFTAEEFDKELGFKKEEDQPKDSKPTDMTAEGTKEEEKIVDQLPTTPQPPAPVPQPPTQPNPEPIVPPMIQDQTAPPAIPMTATDPQPTDSTIDDASLDAILNQLQEKTAAPPANNQQPPQTAPVAGTAPTVPDFGSNS